MPSIAQTRILYTAQLDFQKSLTGLMETLLRSINVALNRSANAKGVIPLNRASILIEEVQDDLTRVFVGSGSPLDSQGRPLSDYALALYAGYGAVSRGVIEAHTQFLSKTLNPETFNWLSRVNFNPVTPRYDPLHLWVDPNGYTLSDRIWSTALSARQKIDKYLEYNIRAGTSAVQMSRDLENLLLPSRNPLRTTKPYGVNISFDASRLARSEISLAHAKVTEAAAAQNPFVTGMDYKLSARHPRVDICDNFATIGMGGERIREPYAVGEAPIPVQDTHPFCLCLLSPFASDLSEANQRLEQMMTEGDSAPLTPINNNFLYWLYGAAAAYLLN